MWTGSGQDGTCLGSGRFFLVPELRQCLLREERDRAEAQHSGPSGMRDHDHYRVLGVRSLGDLETQNRLRASNVLEQVRLKRLLNGLQGQARVCGPVVHDCIQREGAVLLPV